VGRRRGIDKPFPLGSDRPGPRARQARLHERIRMRSTALAIVLALFAPAMLAAKSPDQLAEAALRAAPVWDGHNDVPEQLRERRRNMIESFDFRDTTGTADPANKRAAMQTDLTRLRQGKVGAQFWSVY